MSLNNHNWEIFLFLLKIQIPKIRPISTSVESEIFHRNFGGGLILISNHTRKKSQTKKNHYIHCEEFIKFKSWITRFMLNQLWYITTYTNNLLQYILYIHSLFKPIYAVIRNHFQPETNTQQLWEFFNYQFKRR